METPLKKNLSNLADHQTPLTPVLTLDNQIPSTSASVLDKQMPSSSAVALENQMPSIDKPELPSPFKRALLGPAPKAIISKRKKEKLPAVVTSPQMLQYYKKKEQQKLEAERQKEEKKRAREIKRKDLEDRKMEMKRKKTVEEVWSSESSSEGHMSFQESDVSWDEKSDEEEEIVNVNSLKDLKQGDFILVEFKGGKRMVSNFIYLCVIQKIVSPEKIEIMGLRST